MSVARAYNILALTIAVCVVALPVVGTQEFPHGSQYARLAGVVLYMGSWLALLALIHPRVRAAWLTTRSRIVSGASLLVIVFFVLYPLWFAFTVTGRG